MPGGTFLNSITLTDNNVIGNVVSDFQAKLRPTSYTLNPISQSAFGEICFNQILSTGSATSLSTTPLLATSYRYQVNSGVLSEGVDLTFTINAEATYTGATPTPNGNNNAYYQVQIVRWRGGNKTILSTGNSIQITSPYTPTTLSVTIPLPNLQLNDEFAIEAIATDPNVYLESTSRFTTYQIPIPNSSVSIIPNFWISSSGLATTLIQSQTSGAFGNNLLVTSASSELINYYGSPTVYQANIIGSGFNPIVTPWSIKYGDEFRFEGKEDRVYQIKQAAVVNLNILSSQIPFLVVELNQPVPTSGSVNFDQFLIRRYVDNAAGLILNGLKPSGFDSPYLIKPEYISEKMEQNIGKYIEDLTQKGLL